MLSSAWRARAARGGVAGGSAGAKVKTHIRRVILESERRSERASATIRLLSFIGLSVVLLSVQHHGPTHLGIPVLVGYAVVTAADFWVTRRGRIDVPPIWLAFVLATCDVLLLLALLTTIAQAGHVPFTETLALPIAALIYLFLAHAAIRYHPGLVVYTAGLFIGSWLLVFVMLDWLKPEDLAAGELIGGPLHGPAHGVAVRMAIVALTAVALAFVVARKHQLRLANIVASRMRSNLAPYLPPNLVSSLSYEGAAAIERPQRLTAAVLFADIRGFTSMSERQEPEAVAAFLNDFRSLCARAVFEHGGTLDKFVGDSVMAVFGAPATGANDARMAIAAAFGLLHEVEQWSRRRAATGAEPVGIGIGIHCGPVMAGVIGHPRRLEYTVIGDTVNTAERIERLTREYDVDLLVSREAADAAGKLPGVEWVELPPQPVRGRSQPVRLCRAEYRAPS